MLDTTKNSKEGNVRLVHKLANLLCKFLKIKHSERNAFLKSKHEEFANSSEADLLTRIARWENEIAYKAEQHKAKVAELKARREYKEAQKNKVSPSKGQKPISKNLLEARDIINAECTDYVYSIKKFDGYIAPLALLIPPGGGKTFSIAKMSVLSYMMGIPVVVLTPTHDLADEFIKDIEKKICDDIKEELESEMASQHQTDEAIRAAKEEVVHYKGRQPLNKKGERNEFTCFQYESTGIAGENNQPISSSLCYTCPNGHMGEILHGPEENKEHHIQWFTKEKVNQSLYEKKDCQYLRKALPAQLAKMIIVAPTSAYSDAMNAVKNEDGSKTQRLVIVDERVDLNRRVEVTHKTCQGWLETLTAIIKSRAQNVSEDDPKLMAMTRTSNLLKKIITGFPKGQFSTRAKNNFKSLSAKDEFNKYVAEFISLKNDFNKLKAKLEADALVNGIVKTSAFEETGIKSSNSLFDTADQKDLKFIVEDEIKTVESISQWINLTNKVITEVAKKGQQASAALAILKATSVLLRKVDRSFENELCTNPKDCAYAILRGEIEFKELVNEMVAVKKELQQLEITNGGITSFERIGFYQEVVDHDPQAAFNIPMRAFCDLADAMKEDRFVAEEDSFSFVIHVLTQIATRAMDRGRVIFADASMPDELQELVESKGGKVVRLSVAQNIHTTRVFGHNYSKGTNGEDRPRKLHAAMQDIFQYCSDFKEGSPNDLGWSILTHQVTFEQLGAELNLELKDKSDIFNSPVLQEFRKKTGVEAGWFNSHDRGHNRWKDRNIALFGHVCLPQRLLKSMYESARAMMRVCGNESWGEWNGEVTDAKEVGYCVPMDSQEVKDEAGNVLKHSSKAREWYFKWIAANLVQAIGRSRAVASEVQIECFLLGGIDLPEIDALLKDYGITINARVKNTVHVTLEVFYARGASDQEIDEQCLEMFANNELISIDNVIKQIKAKRGVAAGSDRVGQRIKHLRNEGHLPKASVSATEDQINQICLAIHQNNENVSKSTVAEKLKSQCLAAGAERIRQRIEELRQKGLIPAATKGGRPTRKAMQDEVVTPTQLEVTIIKLDDQQEKEFKDKYLDKLFSGQCDLDGDYEEAIITLDDEAVQVYKVGTDYYRECTV